MARKAPLWKVTIDGLVTLQRAWSQKAAVNKAIQAYVPDDIRAVKATTNDETWQLAMGGYVPEE